MRGYTHCLTGALFGLAGARLIVGHDPNPPELALVALVTAGAGFAPDIDHPSATIAHTFGKPSKWLAQWVEDVSGGHRHKTHTIPGAFAFGAVAWLLEHFGYLLGWATGQQWLGLLGQYLAVICCLGLALPSLGLVRKGKGGLKPPAVFALCAVFVVVTGQMGASYAWVPAAVVVGCVAHLAGDLLTEQGVMIGWPLTRYRFKLGQFDTGKWPERAIVAPLVVAAIGLVAVVQLGYGAELAHTVGVVVGAALT